jgi:hypothetical protein
VGQDGLLAESAADLVGLDVDVLVEVDHGLHGDLGVGVAAPLWRICSACTGPLVFSTRPNSPTNDAPGTTAASARCT